MDFAPINGRRRAQKRKYGLKYVGNYPVRYERCDRNNDRCDRES